MHHKKKISDRVSVCTQREDKEWKLQKKSKLSEQAAGVRKRQAKEVDEDG